MNRRVGRPSVLLETSAEREAFAAATYFARQHGLARPPESAFLTALPNARNHLLSVLAASVLVENFDGLPEPVSVATVDPVLPHDRPGVERWLADAVGDLSPAPSGAELAILTLPRSEVAVVVPVLPGPAYRPQPVGDVYACTRSETASLSRPGDLLDLLVAEGVFEDAALDRLADALENAVANLALASLAEQVFPRLTANESPLDGVSSRFGGADPAARFERLNAVEESTTLTNAKFRSLSPAAAQVYAAEFTDAIDVRFVAVANEQVLGRQQSSGRSITDRLTHVFDGLDAAIEDAAPPGRDPREFTLFPIHPWQFYHVLFDRFEREIADGVIVPLGYHAPATPLSNLRTVVPFADGGSGADAPHLKLTLAVQKSSTVRYVRPQSVANGPQIADVLCAIEPALDRMGLLAEEATACYHPAAEPTTAGDDYDAACNLSALVRTNPHTHPLATDRHPVMAGSLFAGVPGRDGPLAVELLETFADARDEPADRAAGPFFDAYLDTMLPDLLRLATVYGVGLSPHPQNCIVVFDDDARPVASLLRDFGDIRIATDRLHTHGFDIDFYPNSDPDAESLADVHGKLYSQYFSRHLGELVGLLGTHTALSSEELWRRIASRSRAVYDDLRREDRVSQSWVDADERALFAERIPYKASTRMVLEDMHHEPLMTDVPNPLAEVE